MFVVFGEVCPTFATAELYLSEDLCIVCYGGETSVFVLDVPSGDGDIFCKFEEIFVVSTIGADYPRCAGVVQGLFGDHKTAWRTTLFKLTFLSHITAQNNLLFGLWPVYKGQLPSENV